MNRMEALIWILLPGFTAVASGLLAWFIMQSRLEVALALQREHLAETKGALDAEKSALGASLDTALRAAGAVAKQEALEHFMDELRVEQRHYTRENRTLTKNRKTLVLQERMYFRNIPLSDWIEHEVMVDEGADVKRLVQDMTIFDKGVVSIADATPLSKMVMSCTRRLTSATKAWSRSPMPHPPSSWPERQRPSLNEIHANPARRGATHGQCGASFKWCGVRY